MLLAGLLLQLWIEDVLVNGKFVAKGEVVVIEESFGIRVTEIIK